MSSIVCQGIQSCLEARFVEPRVLRTKLTPPKSNPSQEHQENPHNEEENIKHDKNRESGSWNFIEDLTNTPQNLQQATETEKVYVHPLVKRSTSTLSKRSLDMCTESLGSETGSDISESSDDFSTISSRSEKTHTMQRSKSREFGKKLARRGSFPPPLTSISGSNGVQVRPHREGGRLVIKAVPIVSSAAYFKAKRGGGRLRLCLVKDKERDFKEVANEVVEEHNESEDEDEGFDDESEFGGGGGGGDDVERVGDMEGNSGNVGGEIEIGEFPCRTSRCQVGGGNGSKGMSSWGPCLVATS
ncbi:acyl-CoA N-acyltransferases (NAT) superfamily protein [Actinidia rufa]|uniref:Acyl-CoA N-acyltransferases (NAT) superfamily protein n=1 Tax=Actinidia rufa TaxID=165716 RepID=A0A7J0G5I0_9ERIC|nr:acyl-CoA N-acyltransferases (NAT) superfamily protein [Actinidia rufa]